jgi:hypothetical protein
VERVRVKDPVSGHEFTTTRDHAESNGLTVLDRPAVDAFGRDVPAKHNVTKAGAPAAAKKEQ